MARVVVLDASVVVALFDDTDSHHDWAVSVFIDTTGDQLLMSSLTMAEVLVHPARADRLDSFQTALSGLAIDAVELGPQDAIALATLRAQTALKMPDAVVLHTACRHQATLATADSTLASVATEHGCRVLRPDQI